MIPLPVRVASVLLISLMLQVKAEETTTLTLQSPWPQESRWHGELVSASKDIFRETESRVTLTWVAAADPGEPQGGVWMGTELMDAIPLSRVLMLPYRFKSAEEANQVLGAMRAPLQAQATAKGLKLVGVESMGFLTLMSTQSVRSPDALADSILWAPKEFAQGKDYWKAMGVKQIRELPLDEVAEGLENGTLHTVLSSPTLSTLFQWHRHLTHALDLPWMQSLAGLAIDTQALDALRPEDAEQVTALLSARLELIASTYQKHEDFRRRRMVRRQFAFEQPTPSEQTQWKQRADALVKAEVEAGRISQGDLTQLEARIREARTQTP